MSAGRFDFEISFFQLPPSQKDGLNSFLNDGKEEDLI